MADPITEMMSEGAPAISFKDESMNGRWIVGTVVHVEKRQQTDYHTKRPKFYDEEKTRPMWGYVFTLATDTADSTDPDDDGMRRLFTRGGLMGAVIGALKKAGISDTPSALGGKLGVRWNGYGEQKEGAAQPPKKYEAKFAPGDPVSTMTTDPVPPPPSNAEDFGEEPF